MTTKLAISVPDDIAASAREAVRRGDAASISAWFAAAADHYRQAQSLDEWLDGVDAELGAPSAGAAAWAESQLGASPRRARRSA